MVTYVPCRLCRLIISLNTRKWGQKFICIHGWLTLNPINIERKIGCWRPVYCQWTNEQWKTQTSSVRQFFFDNIAPSLIRPPPITLAVTSYFTIQSAFIAFAESKEIKSVSATKIRQLYNIEFCIHNCEFACRGTIHVQILRIQNCYWLQPD